MSKMSEIRDFYFRYRAAFFEPPKFISISRDEQTQLHKEVNLPYSPPPSELCRFMDSELEITPYAPEMRQRRLELERACSYMTEIAGKSCLTKQNRQMVIDNMGRTLEAYILKDTTFLLVDVEHDPWAWFKRKLRLTRWLPIKTKIIRLEGKVLYPWLNIQLPLNRHTVKFRFV